MFGRWASPVGSFVVVVAALGLASPGTANDATDIANNVLCGFLNPPVQACFQPALDLGPVTVPLSAFVDPPEEPVGLAGLVRLIVMPGVVEVPAASVHPTDLCAPYALVPFPCQVALSLALGAPGVEPGDLAVTLGNAVVGTLTVKVNGQPVAVVPGFVDIVCEVGSHGFLFDADCDGDSSLSELQAPGQCPANPFYKYSTLPGPGKPGPGGCFGLDFDADGASDTREIRASQAGDIRSDPTQRCSTPVDPDGDGVAGGDPWTPGDPACEPDPIL